MTEHEGRTRIKELLESFGLWDRRKDPAGTWSHGMKKKLAVARAMLHRPALLFLDEPSARLDPVAAAGLREELASVVRREGVTVFLTPNNFPSFVLVQLLSGLMAVLLRANVSAIHSKHYLQAAFPIWRYSSARWSLESFSSGV